MEKLSVLSGGSAQPFQPRTPQRLRAARTCYDHMAGALGVAVHDALVAWGWLEPCPGEGSPPYELTPAGARALAAAVLKLALHRKWVARERDGRALRITALGRDELYSRLGVDLEERGRS